MSVVTDFVHQLLVATKWSHRKLFLQAEFTGKNLANEVHLKMITTGPQSCNIEELSRTLNNAFMSIGENLIEEIGQL